MFLCQAHRLKTETKSRRFTLNDICILFYLQANPKKKIGDELVYFLLLQLQLLFNVERTSCYFFFILNIFFTSFFLLSYLICFFQQFFIFYLIKFLYTGCPKNGVLTVHYGVEETTVNVRKMFKKLY
jgi:hypothetical protein